MGPMGEKGLSGEVGPAGPQGPIGPDGLGFEDFDVQRDDERTVRFVMSRDGHTKEWSLKLAHMLHQGVFVAGKSYEPGDVVTWAGSSWHCLTETDGKPGESRDWQLIVKSGRPGKDGPPGPAGPQGPQGEKGGRW